MGDGVLSTATLPGAPPDSYSMDLDHYMMDELFLQGCWLETTDESEFLHQSESPLFDPSFLWPNLEMNGDLVKSQANEGNNQDERQTQNPCQEIQPNSQQPLLISQDMSMTHVSGCSGNSEIYPFEGSELGRRWWIGPSAYPGPSVMERLVRAILDIRGYLIDKDVLVQVWVPVNQSGRRILATNDMLFSRDTRCPRLAKYRDISVNYQFSAEEQSKGLLAGLPGRVFLGKVPEWTPDVRFFRSHEYPRVDHAQQYDVRGSLALPVFEQASRTCLGVIEVVMTTQQIKYSRELESVCKALENVDLRSSEVFNNPSVKACYTSYSYQAALPEIKEVLRSACEIHQLPLAQTWVSCIQQGKEGCRHSDENYSRCVSTVDHACHVNDKYIQGFHEACSEHHLLKGEGVAGEAFLTNQPCFSPDITSFGKIEYPLAHHARMFGLRAAVAIRLRSIFASKEDFVLEFFLPTNCTNPEEQKKLLSSLSMIIKQVCRSLRVVMDKEVEEEKESNLSSGEPIGCRDGISSKTAYLVELEQNETVASLPAKENSNKATRQKHSQEDSNIGGSIECVGECPKVANGSFLSVGSGKMGEKRRTKAEKAITLEVLRQYFPGSLKDAAKNIGVCTTTLKRICRQHGIRRWPSRKIKKVGHSLQKLQLVIDSVQGASGAFQIDSFYSNFPELASPNLSGSSPLSTPKQSDQPGPSPLQPEVGKSSLSPQLATSTKSPSSSCSQSSNSSHSFSSMTDMHHHSWNVSGTVNTAVGDDFIDGGAFKRIVSEADLTANNASGVEAELLPRSCSHDTLIPHTKTESQSQPDLPMELPIMSNDEGSQIEEVNRVKATYGDEKTRFRLPKKWKYEDLMEEIRRRFNLEDMSNFDVKYLDDDNEWVLLTCDDDVQECIEVGKSCESRTIKLSVHASNRMWRRCLGHV